MFYVVIAALPRAFSLCNRNKAQRKKKKKKSDNTGDTHALDRASQKVRFVYDTKRDTTEPP
jgi:hypothetical protein